MITYQTTSGILSIIIVVLILWLIRSDNLHPKIASGWILLACTIGIIGLFPEISNWIANKLGVHYAPTIVLVIGMIVIFLKLLQLDIARSQVDKKVAILTQRLVVLEKRFERHDGVNSRDHN